MNKKSKAQPIGSKNLSRRYIGVDIGKSSFFVAFPQTNLRGKRTYQVKTYANTTKGIRQLMTELTKGVDHCVMEATGNYSLELSYTLSAKGHLVSVENPKRVKHFAKLMLSTVKTDKQDAQLLSLFGQQIKPQLFVPKSKNLLLLKQKRQLLTQLQTKRTAFNNMKDALTAQIYPDASTKQHLSEVLSFLDEKIKALKKELVSISKKEFEQQYRLLLTIPGIGARLATALIEVTNGFTSFDNAKQLAKFIGIAPTYFQSGSSLNLKGSINRAGNNEIRSVLYMSSLSAFQKNPPCKALYNRLKEAKKPSKLALVAVMHKLIRQAFGVVKSQQPFDADYVHGLKPKTT